jgi:outer membrane protein assembly factor BamB
MRVRRWMLLLMAVGVAVVGVVPASGAPRRPRAFTDWPTYHLDTLRTGNDTTEPPLGTLGTAWTTPLDGAVYAEPLMVGGLVIAATEHDTVYALDPSTGDVVWKRNLGTPVPLSQLPCGNIDPLGITATPAYDAGTGRMFVSVERETKQQAVEHVLFALDPATGKVLGHRGLDPKNSNPTVEQQRSGLAIGNGYVYVAFGALAGDCGGFHGMVVGVPVSMKGETHAYIATRYVKSAQEGGIWATPGPTVDQDGQVFVSVGNGRFTDPFDYSDAIVSLTSKLKLLDYFAPTTWQSDNQRDLDLGSQGATFVGSYVYADGKSGTAYLLRQISLGHIGGQVTSATVCNSFGGTAVVKMTVYVPCTDGVRAVSVSGGKLKVLWHATPAAKGPPVLGGGAVWTVAWSATTLYALDPATGATLQSISTGVVPHFATPMLSGGMAFIGTMSGVVAIDGV